MLGLIDSDEVDVRHERVEYVIEVSPSRGSSRRRNPSTTRGQRE